MIRKAEYQASSSGVLRSPNQQKAHADCRQKCPAAAIEPPTNLGANQPLAKVHAGPRIKRDGHPFEYQKTCAEHRELLQHRFADMAELRQKRGENQNRLRIACRHETLLPRNPPERRIVLL